ncbi:MAG: ribose 5-phosphate isomerase B [Armatimonadota bacterium]
MKIAVGFDHGGVVLRDTVIRTLRSLGHEVVDFGTDSEASVDYPDYAEKVARAVVSGECDRGFLACGTGIGVSIAANKIPGCYAARVTDCYSAKMAAEHNGANVLCTGGRVVGTDVAAMLVETYLAAAVDHAPRHQRRREKITDLENA